MSDGDQRADMQYGSLDLALAGVDAVSPGQQVDVTAAASDEVWYPSITPHCVAVIGDVFDRGMTTFYPASPRTLPIRTHLLKVIAGWAGWTNPLRLP